MTKFILRWAINAIALYLAVLILPGRIELTSGLVSILWLALIFGLINALFRPQTLAPGQAARPVTVECGSDGRFLGVAVLDEHGLFRDEDLFRGIGKALEHEQKGISEDAPHAHLGFRIMLSTLSHLVINVDPGRCTEIIGLVDLRMTLRELRAAVPSLGLFTNNGKR